MGVLHTKILAAIGASAVLGLAASPASAHAFGTRYDLPLPLTLYLIGAGAAVALSFAVMARFLKHRGEAEEALRFDLLSLPGIGWLGASATLDAVRSLSVAVFVKFRVNLLRSQRAWNQSSVTPVLSRRKMSIR